MNLFKLCWRHLSSKPLATFLSVLLLTLGAGLISFLLLLSVTLEERLTRNISGIDMVLGAKGSPLQLILSSIYQADAPTGNILLQEAEKLVRNPAVALAIPLAYGDNYQGYRIVGTTTQYVTHYGGEVAQGRLWRHSFEACIGALVAGRLGLQVGDTFTGTHGLVSEGGHAHEEEPYRVVGILGHAGSILDQLVLTDVESVWKLHAHEKQPAAPLTITAIADSQHEEEGHHHPGSEEEHHEHEAEQEITAMLVKFRNPMAALQLPRQINTQSRMQAAVPAIEVNRLFSLLGFGVELLQGIAFAIMGVAGISVFVSLYNSLKERRYELAVMRTLGASRFELFGLVMLEAVQLSLLGFTAGILSSRIGMVLLAGLVSENLHGSLYTLGLQQSELYLLMGCLLTGFIAALLPAVQALSTDISKTLSDA